MNQSVMNWSYTEPAGWWEPAVVAQFTVAMIALFGPILVYWLNNRKIDHQRALQSKRMRKSIRIELGYISRFIPEALDFWDNNDFFNRNQVDNFRITIPPLIATPTKWVETLPDQEIERLSAIVTQIYFYNQVITEFRNTFEDFDEARVKGRCKGELVRIHEDLKFFLHDAEPFE